MVLGRYLVVGYLDPEGTVRCLPRPTDRLGEVGLRDPPRKEDSELKEARAAGVQGLTNEG